MIDSFIVLDTSWPIASRPYFRELVDETLEDSRKAYIVYDGNLHDIVGHTIDRAVELAGIRNDDLQEKIYDWDDQGYKVDLLTYQGSTLYSVGNVRVRYLSEDGSKVLDTEDLAEAYVEGEDDTFAKILQLASEAGIVDDIVDTSDESPDIEGLLDTLNPDEEENFILTPESMASLPDPGNIDVDVEPDPEVEQAPAERDDTRDPLDEIAAELDVGDLVDRDEPDVEPENVDLNDDKEKYNPYEDAAQDALTDQWIPFEDAFGRF